MTASAATEPDLPASLRRLTITASIELLLRAGIFGLVISQYTFGGSILPLTFTYALAYAVFSLISSSLNVYFARFSPPPLVMTSAVILIVIGAVLITLQWNGLTTPWLIAAAVPVMLPLVVLIYRALRSSRTLLARSVENLVYPVIGDGLEGVAPEMIGGVILILFGRQGILSIGVLGAIGALLFVAISPQALRARRAEGTGVTVSQLLGDINTGLNSVLAHPRLTNLQLAALGANFVLSAVSSLLFPLSLLRGNGKPDVLLWIQGGALLGVLVGVRVLNGYRSRMGRPVIFFGSFIATGLLSLLVMGLNVPVYVWAAGYSVLAFVSLSAISPMFNQERSRVSETAILRVADQVSFSASVLGIATAGIVIERMLTPALAPGGILEPWLTPWIGTGPAAPLAAYWLIGGLALPIVGIIAWQDFVRRPIGPVAVRPVLDETVLATPPALRLPASRIAIAIGLAVVASMMVAIGLGSRAGEVYTVVLSVCAVIYILVSVLLWVGWPRARLGAGEAATTFGLAGLGLAALVAGTPIQGLAAVTLPLAATRLPRLSWLPITGVQIPPYVSGVIRVLGQFGAIVAGVNALIWLGPVAGHDLAIWLTALTLFVGGVIYLVGAVLRYLATHRSVQRTQLGLLAGGGALPLVPTIIGAALLAYVFPDLLSAAPIWVSAAALFSLLTPMTYGFVFWNPPGRMMRLERRIAPVLWVIVIATLYVLASLALRGWGVPWAVDIGLAVAAIVVAVVGLRDWMPVIAHGRGSDLERSLLRRPTLEAVDQALIDLAEQLNVPGLILAHEQPGRRGWMLRRTLETEALTLDESTLPAAAPDDCLVAAEAAPGTGWLAAPWVAVAQPIRVEGQPALACLLLPRRGRPYLDADLKLVAQVADALATPLQVITLRWAALRPYREREQAQREERTRIARRLHAEVLQSLAPLPGYLAIAAQRSEDASLREMLSRQEQEVVKVDDAIRQVVTAIRPASLNAPLAVLMEQALRRAATESPDVQFQSDIQVQRDFDLPVEAKWPVHNIVDNALSNARKHAQAKNVWLTLRREGLHLVIVVEDDGVGIPLKEGETDALALIRNGHFGLADMFDDAEQLNGRLAIGRRMSGGTYVRLWFPVEAER